MLTIAALVLWAVLALVAVLENLEPGFWVAAALCVLAIYFRRYRLFTPASSVTTFAPTDHQGAYAMTRPVLLIAGGSRGIGAATARFAGERGYDVAVNYVKRANAAAKVADAVQKSGGKRSHATGRHDEGGGHRARVR